MNICFDALSLYELQGTGLYSYSYALIQNLMKLSPKDNCQLLWDTSPHILAWENQNQLKYSPVRINRINNNFSELETFLRENKIDVFHSPNNGFSIPTKKVCPYIMTAHDLLSISCEKYSDKKYTDKFLSLFPQALKNSDKIIAVSNFIKAELLKYFRIDEEKIEVIYPSILRDIPKDIGLCGKNILKHKYNIESPFILYVGSLHVRKNLRSLICTFKEIKAIIPNIKLVIVGQNKGKRYDYYTSLLSLCENLNLSDSVIFTGTVHQKDIYYFYSQCLCLISLSEYEGFPISLVESMTCGAPIVCSSIAAHLEAVGDAALTVNQRDIQGIKNSILSVLSNSKLREELSSKAKERSRQFNGEYYAEKVLNLYKSLYK